MSPEVEQLCRESSFKEAVLESMKREAEETGLKGFERVKEVVLEPEMFTVENGLLTPTFKLKRHQLKQKYADEIDRMYARRT